METKFDDSQSDSVKTASEVTDAFPLNAPARAEFDGEGMSKEMDRSELHFARQELDRIQAELNIEREARWRAECNLSRAGSSLIAARSGLEMVLARLNQPESSLHAGWAVTHAASDVSQVNSSTAQKVDAEKEELSAKIKERDSEIQALKDSAATAQTSAEVEIRALKEEIASMRARLDKVTEDSSAAITAQATIGEQLENERSENIRQCSSHEAGQKKNEMMIFELVKAVIGEEPQPEHYGPILEALFTSSHSAAASKEPGDAKSWTIGVPCLEVDGKSEDFERLVSNCGTWALFLNVLAVAKSGKFNTIRGVRLLKALASYLGTAMETQLDVLDLVINSIADGLHSVEDGVCANSARLLFWEIANIIEKRWPSLDISQFRRAVVHVEFLVYELTQALDSNTVATFVTENGSSSDGVGMIMCDHGALLVVDWTQRAVWFTTRWTAKFGPKHVEATSDSGVVVKLFVAKKIKRHREIWETAQKRAAQK
ncbi:hypothetical protein VTJ49DRAFT_4308 [Mycothermus thermophilus]|uniref:Uncharacterized protein n=1 Tax=Humicola insolens TaxID=85995 RepID=A0ABR3V5R8_HUMIN